MAKKRTTEELIDQEFPTGPGEVSVSSVSSPDQLMYGNGPDQEKIDILAQFTGQKNPIYATDIDPSFEDKLAADADSYAGAIPAQSFQTYFPSMANDIHKGNYTGQIIGSNPIYASAALMPYGIIDARQNALKAAADKKIAQSQALAKKFQEMTAPPTTKHKAVQQDIQNNFYSWLSDAQQKAKDKYPGQDYHAKLMNDPQFLKELNFYKNIAEYETQLVDQTALIEEGIKSGKYAETPVVRQRLNEIYTGKHGVLNEALNPEGYQKAMQQFNLAPITDLLETSKAAAKDLDYGVFEGMPNLSPQEKYDMLITTKTENVAKKRLDDITEQTWKARYEGKEDLINFTKKDLRDAIAANFAPKTTRTVQTASTSAGGGGLNFKFDPNAVEQETKVINATGVKKDGTQFKVNVPTEDGYTMPKAITAKLATGSKWFDIGDSQGGNVALSKTSGVKDVDISEIRNFYMSDGKILTSELLDKARKDGKKVEVKTFVVGSFGGDESTKDEYKQKTVVIPIEEVKGSIEQRDEKGNFIKGVDTKYYEEKAKSRSQYKNINGFDYTLDELKAMAKEANMSEEEALSMWNKAK